MDMGGRWCTLRITATAAASLADILLRSRFGMAMLAMIRMISTTMSSSISENPFSLRYLVIDLDPVQLKMSSANPAEPRAAAVLLGQLDSHSAIRGHIEGNVDKYCIFNILNGFALGVAQAR